MKATSLSISDLRDAMRALPDNGLASSREIALAHFDEHGLPTLRDEDWKYTDLAAVVEISNRWLREGGEPLPSSLQSERIEAITNTIDATWLVISNGIVDERSTKLTVSGVEVSRLSDAPSPFVLERPLADLNAALLQDGLRIRITGNVEKPIGILVIDNAGASAGVTQSRVEVEVSADASVEFVEYHGSDGNEDHYANTVLSMAIGAGASVKHVRIRTVRSVMRKQAARLLL